MTHDNILDYICPMCHMTIQTGIPHECNYMICHKCSGTGKVGWREREVCDWCSGTGQWVQQEEPPEDNKIGALV